MWVRGLDLCSFYAILLPGIACTIAIVPLLLATSNVNPRLAVIPLVATGFVVELGRHTIAVLAQMITTSSIEFSEFVNASYSTNSEKTS